MSNTFNKQSRHWIGTVWGDHPHFWEDEQSLSHISYIKLQKEKGKENGLIHFQIYMCLKDPKGKRGPWIKKHLTPFDDCHWEVKQGTVQEAIDYVSKEDSRVEGDEAYSFEFGEKPVEQSGKGTKRTRDETTEKTIGVVDDLKTRYIPFECIDSEVLLYPNFVPVYEKLTSGKLGPYRPNLKVICVVGFSGCGKTFSFNKWFHNYVKCIYGNCGAWFQNTNARVLLLDEFNGQIPPQALLSLLEGYPHALEIKGGLRPALYELVVIFSNVRPENWYASAEEVTRKYRRTTDSDEVVTAAQKRTETLKAIFDRLGYSTNGEKSVRKTGKTIIISLPSKYQGPLSPKLTKEKEEWIKGNTWTQLEFTMASAWKELTLSPKAEWKYETEEEELEQAKALTFEEPEPEKPEPVKQKQPLLDQLNTLFDEHDDL